MIAEIELHDSKLLQVDSEAGTLLIDAYVHREAPDKRREGGMQRTLFQFSNLRIASDGQDLSGTIHDGTLVSAGLDPNALIPLPLVVSKPVEMKALLLPEGVVATFSGDALTIEEAGPYRFLEFWRD